jgi:hypothetical protein
MRDAKLDHSLCGGPVESSTFGNIMRGRKFDDSDNVAGVWATSILGDVSEKSYVEDESFAFVLVGNIVINTQTTLEYIQYIVMIILILFLFIK